MASLGLLNGLLSGSGLSKTVVAPPVNEQLVASYGSIALNSNTQPQNMVLIQNYNNLPMSSMKLHLEVEDTTGTTAPSGVYSIENVIQSLKLQTNSGLNLFDFNGQLLDISNTARYLNPAGLVNNSPTPADSSASTSYTEDWDIIIPFAVAAKWFPLKLFFTASPLASRASTLNSMTSTINNLSVYASYHPISVSDQAIANQTISVPGTGSTNLSSQLIQDRTYYMQAYQYGDVQGGSSATDSPIGASGNGITFTPTGQLYLQNAPLQSFITTENTKYPNTVSTGVGHETGMVNLFTNTFKATASTNFTIDFTSAPSTGGYGGASKQIRSIWVMNLQ